MNRQGLRGSKRILDCNVLEDKIRRYHEDAYGWALSCCRNDPEQAEEVLQQAYLKILDGRAAYRGKARFRTWLFAVIRCTAKDMQRRRWLRRIRLSRYETNARALYPNNNTSTADGKLMEKQQQEQFRRALADLPPRQREVLQLVFYHDLTIKAAAEVMEVSIGSARTHYDRGKKQMHRILNRIEAQNE